MTNYTVSHLITHSIEDRDLKYLAVIPNKLLSTTETAQVEFIKAFSRKYGTIPTPDLLEVEKVFVDFVPHYTEGTPLKYIADKVFTAIKRRYVVTTIQSRQEKGEDIYDPDFLASLQRETFIPDYNVIDLATYDRNQYVQNRKPIKFNLPFFDELNLARGDFLVMFARMKSYKTFILLLQAYSLFRQGEKVEIYSLELAGVEILQRIDAMIGKINPSWFRSGIYKDTPEDVKSTIQRLNELAKTTHGGHIHIHEGGANLDSIIAEYESLPAEERPTVICIDALEHLSAKGIYESASRSLSLGEVAYGLKAFGVQKGVLVLATTQANRSASTGGKGGGDNTTVAGSDVIARAVDVLLYGQVVDADIPDKNGNPLRFTRWDVSASRHGVDVYTCFVNFKFDKGSVSIHKTVEEAESSTYFKPDSVQPDKNVETAEEKAIRRANTPGPVQNTIIQVEEELV